jgi:hypothetical protein
VDARARAGVPSVFPHDSVDVDLETKLVMISGENLALLGRDLFWWLTKTRLLKKTVESRLASSRICDLVLN